MQITIVDGHGWSFFTLGMSFLAGILAMLILNWVL